MMKIAITGANGFVGSNLAGYFSVRNHQVAALVRPEAELSLLPAGVAVLSIDYSDVPSLVQVLSDADIVIHNAGKTRALSYEEMLGANVGVTRKLLKAMENCPGVRQFIYLSSQAASRPSLPSELIKEEDLSAPVTWYGRSKAMAEKVIREECGVPWTVIRPVPVYGEGDRDFLQLFRVLSRGFSFRIGKQERTLNMIHIGELCNLTELCLDNPKALYETFFASDGETYTQSGIAAAIASLMPGGKRTITIPVPAARLIYHAGDLIGRLRGKSLVLNDQKLAELLAEGWTCSMEKARSKLGWEPRPDLEQNLRRTYQWYLEKGWL
jgi:nucleoside-diphosphate-sugar epimerase